MARPAHDPLLYPPPSPSAATAAAGSHSSKWGPYRNAGDFSLNMALVLLILACALAFVAAFSAALRFFLRRRRSPPPPSADAAAGAADPEKQQEGAGEHGGVAFAAGMEMAGAAAECAICLAEFAEGERVRVLPACSHGFHARCIELWLASKPSCPTCRSSCLSAARGKKQPSPSGTV